MHISSRPRSLDPYKKLSNPRQDRKLSPLPSMLLHSEPTFPFKSTFFSWIIYYIEVEVTNQKQGAHFLGSLQVDEFGDDQGRGAAKRRCLGPDCFCVFEGRPGNHPLTFGHPVETSVFHGQHEGLFRSEGLAREEGEVERHHHLDAASGLAMGLIVEADAVMRVVDGGTVVVPPHLVEVSVEPDLLLARGQLNLRAVQLHGGIEHRTLLGKAPVYSKHLRQGVSSGIDAVKAGGGTDVMEVELREEVDMEGKIPFDPQFLNDVLVEPDFFGIFGDDVDDDRVGVRDSLPADERQQGGQLFAAGALKSFEGLPLEIKGSLLLPLEFFSQHAVLLVKAGDEVPIFYS